MMNVLSCNCRYLNTQANRQTVLVQNGVAAKLPDQGSSYADLDFSDVSITYYHNQIHPGMCNYITGTMYYCTE